VDCIVSSQAIVIVSHVRFVHECLAEILGRDPDLQVQGTCANVAHALETAQVVKPELVLIDAAFPGANTMIRQLRSLVPETRVVAIAVAETEENILAWVKAGIAGYIPNTASVQDLAPLLKEISRGEQSCSTRIAGTLLRCVSNSERLKLAPVPAHLTSREIEILRLISIGLSNKEIARQLGISVSTTKSHVHSLLGKMKLQRRSEVAALLNGSKDDTILSKASILGH